MAKKVITPTVFIPPMNSGEVFDENSKLIGRYVYLTEGDQDTLDNFCDAWLKTSKENSKFFLTIDLETSGLNPAKCDILLFSISWDGKNAIAFSPHDFNIDKLKEVLSNVPISNQNIKFDMGFIYYHYGIEINVFMDTMICAQLGWHGIFPKSHSGTYALGNLADVLLSGYKLEKETRKEFIAMTLDDKFTRKQIEYAIKDSLITHQLTVPIFARLKNQNLWELWEEIERPLIPVAMKAELWGMKVDRELLSNLIIEEEDKLAKSYDEVIKNLGILGVDIPSFGFPKGVFNLGSPAQLNKILGAVGIKVPDARKETLTTAYTSVAGTPKGVVLNSILNWKKAQKILSTYLHKWESTHIDPVTDCVHYSLMTNHSETGRFSSKDPNILTVPGHLRRMLIAREGYSIVSNDYGQYEFRAAAAVTKEEYLIDTFKLREIELPKVLLVAQKYGFIDVDDFVKAVDKKKLTILPLEEQLVKDFYACDPHRRNAALVLNKPIDQITLDDRSIGKCVSVDTMVATSKGMKRVGDFLPKKPKKGEFYPIKGLKVITDTGIKDATKIYYNGISECIKINLRSGRSVTCTPNHLFRVIDKNNHYVWQKSGKLKVNDYLYIKYNGMESLAKPNPEVSQLFGKLLRLDSDVTKLSGYTKSQLSELLADYDVTLTKAKEEIIISSERIKNFIEGKEFPEFIKNSKVNLVAFVKELLYDVTAYMPDSYLSIVQNELTNYGVSSTMVPASETVLNKPGLLILQSLDETNINQDNIETWMKVASGPVGEKLAELVHMKGVSPKNIEEHLEPKEIEVLKFLIKNELVRDRIVSIEKVSKVHTCDLHVPENNTLVYNGIVSHNTLGYAILYGAGPDRIQSQLAEDGFFYSLKECKDFHSIFFSKVPRISKFISDCYKLIHSPGYLVTDFGRKRFYGLPPKYMTKRYDDELASAKLSAVNYNFQARNADALKKAMILVDNLFMEYADEKYRSKVLIPMHDELVTEIRNDHCLELVPKVKQIMINTGLESIKYGCPIEVSTAGPGPQWSK